MFEKLEMAPADPILGLTEAFKADSNSAKVNLGVGVFKDASGTTPTLAAVREAERRLFEENAPKTYLPIHGDQEYGRLVRELLMGAEHPVLKEGRAMTAQTPGGTGALRVAGDFARKHLGVKRVWLSNPTWANHAKVFAAAGVETESYSYYDPETRGLNYDFMCKDLDRVPAEDMVLFHGCCHNPTGVDPTPEQWTFMAKIAKRQGFMVLFDIAYQGFGSGLVDDVAGLHAFLDAGVEVMIASSYSKNFGLYNQRTGALTLVGNTADDVSRAFSHVKTTIRTNYSNPPAYGAAIVRTVLGDEGLRKQWDDELGSMRDRINGMRTLFVDTMSKMAPDRDFSFITSQNGMFSFSGLSREQVERLRGEHSLYIVGSGRINVAGLSENNMDRVCRSIAEVL